MKEIYKKIITFVAKMERTGFFSIVFSNTLVKVVAFLGGTILVRVLNKNDYGVYSYVMNAIGFLFVLGDMGTGMATLQFTQENYKDKAKFKAYSAWGLKMTFVFSFFPVLCVIMSPFYYPFTVEGAKELVVMLFALPFINNLNTFFQTNLRVHLQNNKFAILNIVSIVIHYTVLLPLAFEFGVTGAVLANYGYGLLTLLVAVIINRKNIYAGHKYTKIISREEKKHFFKLSVPTQLNSMISQIMVLIDVFMVGLFFSDSEVIASYKVATTIPSACSFIPTSIMVYAVPYFSRNKDNTKWLNKNFKKLIAMTSSLCLLICLVGIGTAKWVIPLVFGEQYVDAIICYVILLIGFVFSGGLQTPSVNILYTQRKVKINLIITISCGMLNVIFDVIGIKYYGSVGAAIATTMVNIIGAAFAFLYAIIILKKNEREKS